jgi:hypothetical protein
LVNPKQSAGRPAGSKLAGRSIFGLGFDPDEEFSWVYGYDSVVSPSESEQEHEIFAAHYSRMSDSELIKLALESSALSDLAWDALEDELDRRHLEVPEPELAQQILVPERRDLVMLRAFRDVPEALLAKGSLQAYGIECFLADENMVRMDWFISNMLGGIKLLVQPADFSRASRILNEPTSDSFEPESESK